MYNKPTYINANNDFFSVEPLNLENHIIAMEKIVSPDFKQVLIDKSTFLQYINENKWQDLEQYIPRLLKYIRKIQPVLPKIKLVETLMGISQEINTTNLNAIYNISNNEFSNQVSSVGNNYLKYYFQSYWKSAYTGNKSPYDAWLDDKIMYDVIKYRIGCNDSKELFDFSLALLIRGLSARRITISFFKPIVAAAIYKHYLQNIEIPTVLDPCCGFGGRLLGFKSLYPNGTYIGCEPNVETYNELKHMVKLANWNNVTIHNCCFEDFKSNKQNYDLVFTSIPYFDTEIYSNCPEYTDFNDWKLKFIDAFSGYNNCYINCSMDIAKKIGWNIIDSYLVNGGTHFCKDATKKKLEGIFKII